MGEAERRMSLAPGAVLGVFGGGQLGRMFAQAAQRIGFAVHVYAPEANPPAAAVASKHVRAAYEDRRAIETFARHVDAVTYEFENIPADALEAIAQRAPVHPAPNILAITRNRLSEKGFLKGKDIPVTPFLHADSPSELEAACVALGGAAIVKTTELGYDGKGQARFAAGDDPDEAWIALGQPDEVIVEQSIDLAAECSVLVARDARGQHVSYGPFHNVHRNHILDVTTWAAADDSHHAQQTRAVGYAVADALKLEGLICVELFIDRDGNVMVNEIAPRPHNSGHLTIEACSISQFEMQARLTAGWPIEEPKALAPAAAMANLLGDLWANGEPDWSALKDHPDVTLHLYGKNEARPGRKMGHLTALADTMTDAREKVLTARRRLTGN